jgi:hypothetical protein
MSNLKLDAMQKAAIKQAKESKENWFPYYFESVNNGIKVVGESYRIAKKGKNKGQPIPTKQNRKTVILTREMIANEIDD